MAETQTNTGTESQIMLPAPGGGVETPEQARQRLKNAALSYDPNNPTPYVPPPSAAAPEITAPPPSPLASPSQNTTPPVFGGGRMGAIGSIATIGDAILRGAMQGREHAKQMQVVKAKKLMDGFSYAKSAADAEILDMVQKPEVQAALDKRQKLISSKNPEAANALSDDEKKILSRYDNAVNASDSAWQGINQLQGQYLFGGDQKKGSKGKSKFKGGQDTDDPMAMASSSDPATKLKGIFLVRQKLGNPVQYQVKDLLSKVEQQKQDPQFQLDRLKSRQVQLASIPARTPEQDKELTDISGRIESISQSWAGHNLPKPSYQKTPGNSVPANVTTDAFGNPIDRSASTSYNSELDQYGNPTGKVFPLPAAAALSKPKQAWAKDTKGHIYSVNLDPKTNQPIAGTENYSLAPPTSIMPETVKTGEFTFVDEAGKVWRIPTTTVTTHEGGGGGGGAATGGGTKHPSANPKPTAAGNGAASGEGAEAAPTPVPGARAIGQTLSADDKKVHAALIQTAEKARTLTALLSTNESYINAVHADPSKATPRQDLALVVAAVRAMNPGSVRLPQKELELEIKAGSFGDRFRRSWDNATTGLLPADQRDDLFGIVKNETTTFGKNVAADWKTNFPNRPLPAHLKRYADNTAGGPKTVTMDDIQAYAQSKGISIEESKKHATDAGYTIK
jgi:hypothetical protein